MRGIDEARAGERYAPDKWSIKELVGHLIDTERIFSYRVLRFARNDQTPLSGFEQDDYVRDANFDDQLLSDLAAEFEYVRRSNIQLFKSLSEDAWSRGGTANGRRSERAGPGLHHGRTRSASRADLEDALSWRRDELMKVGDVRVWERTFSEEDVRFFARFSGDEGEHHLEPDEQGRLMVHGLLTATLPTKIGGDMNFIARKSLPILT